jgi:23S rRNA (guanosine2251-2'-O)-methyltransferase
MKPPRSDRPRGAPLGAKPPFKQARPHGRAKGGGDGTRTAFADRGKDRGAERDLGHHPRGGSHAGGAEKPRFGSGDTGRPRFGGGGKPRPAEARPSEARSAESRPAQARTAQVRTERPLPPERPDPRENRPTRPLPRVQDRAREGLTRDREIAGRPSSAHRAAAEAPRGTVWLYGLHAVQAALANPARRLRRLVLTEEGSAALAARLPAPWALTPETVDRGRIDQLLGRDAVHQGAALLADLLPQPVLATALERPGPVLVLDQVTDPRNIGAILRSAAAFGVAAVIVQERHAPEETGSLAKAASGALETVPLLRAVNLARTIVMLKAANFWVVGLDAEAGSALDGAPFKERRVALVLGGEGSGLRRLTRESCDELAKLPMAGIMESLNVSAATAVALYELGRTR